MRDELLDARAFECSARRRLGAESGLMRVGGVGHVVEPIGGTYDIGLATAILSDRRSPPMVAAHDHFSGAR